MELLTRDGQREYFSESMPSARRLASPFNGERFACLLWNHGVAPDVDAASSLLGSLLDSGCRYFVCGGDDCEWWHDMADEIFVHQYLNATDAEREQRRVMTTWHANESPDVVAFFFVFNTSFDEISSDRFLVLHLGDGSKDDLVDGNVEAQAQAQARDASRLDRILHLAQRSRG